MQNRNKERFITKVCQDINTFSYNPAFGKVSKESLEKFIDLCEEYGYAFHSDRVAKINYNDLRMFPKITEKNVWINDTFRDPLMKRWRIAKDDDIMSTIKFNNYSAIQYPYMTAEEEGNYMVVMNNLPLLRDFRHFLVDPSNIVRYNLKFSREFIYDEMRRIYTKEGKIASMMAEPLSYFCRPTVIEDSYIVNDGRWAFRNYIDLYDRSKYLIIRTAEEDFLFVRTKLEQWYWEQCFKIYAEKEPEYLRQILVFDKRRENPYECRILVPIVGNPRELVISLFRAKKRLKNEYFRAYKNR